MLSDEQLNEIEARATAATKEPWKAEDPADASCYSDCVGEGRCPDNHLLDQRILLSGPEPEEYQLRFDNEEDTIFIAHARSDVPALVAEVRRLRAMVAKFMGGSSDGKKAHTLY